MKYLRKKISFLMSIIIIIIFPKLSICQSYKNNFSSEENDLSYEKWIQNWETDNKLPIKMCITPGEDESVINFSWYSKENDKSSKLKFYYDNKETYIKVDRVNIGNGFISNKAKVNNLEPNKKYYYSYTINGIWSKKFNINTSDKTKYSFIFMGDPQIGASYKSKKLSSYEDAIKIDAYNWDKSIKTALNKIDKCSFIICGGDETNTINNYSNKQKEYINLKEYVGFLYPENLRHTSVVNVIGNHDRDNIDFYYHFNNPNMDKLGQTKAGGDYYFKYNNTLFLVLNTNNLNIDEHKEFIKKAVDEYDDVTWRVAVFHHDIFGGGCHAMDEDVKYLRSNLPNILKDNNINLVLNGHDHIYSRSKLIDGILYITGGSSTGSKFYKHKEKIDEYVRFRFDKEIPTYSIVNVLQDKIYINTYRIDNNEKIDSNYILK